MPFRNVVHVSATTTVSEAAELCRKHDVSLLPIKSINDEWIGIFSNFFSNQSKILLTYRVFPCRLLRSELLIKPVVASSNCVPRRLPSKGTGCRMGQLLDAQFTAKCTLGSLNPGLRISCSIWSNETTWPSIRQIFFFQGLLKEYQLKILWIHLRESSFWR